MKRSTLHSKLQEIYRALINHEVLHLQVSNKLHPSFRLSGLNLCRYLILRSFDLRLIHQELSDVGISSLRSPEAYVYRNIADAIKLLHLLDDKKWDYDIQVKSIGYKKSKRLIQKHTNQLFGKKPNKQDTHIMITMPTEAAEDYQLVLRLIASGMDTARINMSHDSPEVWQRIIENIRKAEKESNRKCKIYIDLAGPKIRTGPIPVGKKNKKKKGNYIRVIEGDYLLISNENINRPNGEYILNGKTIAATLSVSLPSILLDVKKGHRIFFDDGKIMGKVVEKSKSCIILEVIKAGLKGVKLKAEKGINLPDTHLNLPSLTEEDLSHLPFVAQYADMVGYSFVRRPEDIFELQDRLWSLDAGHLGIVLKIENQEAFYNLPHLLLAAMRNPKVGVMIARGDLAVELGFERISEVQEEILWFCEAAHVPVIWATQVLENLAKKGNASRAEITDAAMSTRAECVMLNKGPFIVEAMETLQNVLTKMQKHQSKKKTRLRSLKIAQRAAKSLDKLTMKE